MEEGRITVPYLARIAGVTEETLWRDVKELWAMVKEEPLQGAAPMNEEDENEFDLVLH